MCSSCCLAMGLEKIRARMASRFKAPSSEITELPKRAFNASIAAPFLPVTAREMASASITVAPWRPSNWATVVFPLPMPPVNPHLCDLLDATARDQPPVGASGDPERARRNLRLQGMVQTAHNHLRANRSRTSLPIPTTAPITEDNRDNRNQSLPAKPNTQSGK
jgi:hypothetical protein